MTGSGKNYWIRDTKATHKFHNN